VSPSWEDTNVEAQAMLLAYTQIREYEETEFEMNLAGAKLHDSI
jgi:hypothetical protein